MARKIVKRNVKNVVITALAAALIPTIQTSANLTSQKNLEAVSYPIQGELLSQWPLFRHGSDGKLTEFYITEPVKIESSSNVKKEFEIDPYFEKLYARRAIEIVFEKPWEKNEFQRRIDIIAQYGNIIANSIDDTTMLAMLTIESAGDPSAQSPTGPRGLPQFTSETARKYGLRIDTDFDERIAPIRALPAMDAHLRDAAAIETIGSSLERMLYFYHDGLLINQSGSDLYQSLSQRVKWYIVEIGAIKKLIEDGVLRYNPTSEYTQRLSNTLVYTPEPGETAYGIAKKHNVDLDTLHYFNPEVRNLARIPNGANLKIPKN